MIDLFQQQRSDSCKTATAMGGSDGNEGGSSGAVDSSVGTIVWVRRRNGSWWPGRILGSDELSASHLMSPRSGTPVKLLGRDDASVDWYNLEKSKRVKAFRCGEFDACIARAEASQGMPIKKREKYARREDAIIHALELEQQQLEMRTSKPRISNAHKQESSSFSFDVYNSDTDPRAGARMRGLQNFGLRIAPPKKKHSQFVPWEEASGNSISNVGVDIPDASHYGSGKSKRKMIGGTYDDCHAKKRKPIVQVLKNSAKLPASLPLQFEYSERDNVSNSYDSLGNNGDPIEGAPGDSSDYSGHLQDEYSSSEMAEETESDSMGTEYLEHDTEDDGSFTDTTQSIVPAPRYRRLAEKFNSPNHKIPDRGVSNWHIKGKRNTRNILKKSSDFIYENTTFSDSFKRNSINLRKLLSSSRKLGISQRKYPSNGNSVSSEDDEEDDFYYYNDVVDVNVEVEKQSYKYNTVHVPWVSISSKGSHGRPVVGHPIQVEVLEEGSTDGLMFKHEVYEEPPAVHKFAKRTSSYRIPRSNIDDDGDPLYSDHEEKQRVKKSNASSKWRTSKKKTRTLSSLGSEKKHSRRSSSVLDGLIKAEDRIPIVTCIPVKVVFSRILEMVGRSSLASAHRRGML